MPEASIIMAAYNAERYIAESIASMQAQTFENWELIVVDDGSTDSTVIIAEEIAKNDSRIRLIRQENSGHPGWARNSGLEIAKGDFVGFIDADDAYAPKRLKICVDALRRCENCGLVFHDLGIMDETSIVFEPALLRAHSFLQCDRINVEPLGPSVSKMNSGLAAFLFTDYVAVSTNAVLIRVNAFSARTLRFREDVVIAEDLDLFVRLLLERPAVFVDQALARYRQHSGGITNQRLRFLEDTIRVIEDHRRSVEKDAFKDVAPRLKRRLRILHEELAYLLLLDHRSEAARYWFYRGLINYGGRKNAIGLLKSFLPWGAIREKLQVRGRQE